MNEDRKVRREFQQADAAIERAVAAFMIKVNLMLAESQAVAPTYIVENVLLTLCEELTKLIDDPVLAEHMGPATLKLSNALADYRDSRSVDRGD
jgi:hypothetical protein